MRRECLTHKIITAMKKSNRRGVEELKPGTLHA